MSLNPVAIIMLKALQVASPDPVTIEPKDAADEIALNQLMDAEYVELWDMHQNGDRRWMITKTGCERVAPPTTPAG